MTTCPHCGNDDKRMQQVVAQDTKVMIVFCEVCSKLFKVEKNVPRDNP